MKTKTDLRNYYETKAQQLDEIGLTYASPNLYKSFFYRQRSAGVLAALGEVRPDDWVLDVGGGAGYYANVLAQHGCRVILTDLSSTLLQQARGADSRLMACVCCDAEFLPFRDESFDHILFSEVLEHLPDGTRALSESERVARPGGFVVITTPSRWSPMNLAYALKRRMRRYAFNEHIREYTIRDFRRLLSGYLKLESFQFANYLVPYPLDNLFIVIGSPQIIRGLASLESRINRTPLLRCMGWTMIARCRKT